MRNPRSTKVALLLLAGLGGAVVVYLLLRPTPQTGAEHAEPAAGGSESPSRAGDEIVRAGANPRAPAPTAGAGVPEPPSMPAAPAPFADVTVSGHVSHHDDHTPAPSVDVIFTKDRAEWTATSDSSGAYSLVLTSGTYQVRALGDRLTAIDLPPLTVAGDPLTYDVTVVQQALIRGRAVDRDGRAAKGAIVVPVSAARSAALLSMRGELGAAEVAADGSFELFSIPGDILLHASDGESSGVLPVLALKAHEERTGVKIVLLRNGVIAGLVRNPKGLAVPGATVLASVQIPGTTEYDRVPVTADKRGHFQWRVPRSGHTIVEAAAPGYAQSAPQEFTLDPGEDRNDIELTLRPATLVLAGHVVDTMGAPLADVEIAQGQEGSKARYKRVFTDDNGWFEITELSPGPHRLRARKLGYQQVRVRQIIAPASDITIVMPLEPAGTTSP